MLALVIEEVCIILHFLNKAIVDYTSPALCTPVTPFPTIGDAAYRQRRTEPRT